MTEGIELPNKKNQETWKKRKLANTWEFGSGHH